MKKVKLTFMLLLACFGYASAQQCAPATNLQVTYSPTCSRANLSWEAPVLLPVPPVGIMPSVVSFMGTTNAYQTVSAKTMNALSATVRQAESQIAPALAPPPAGYVNVTLEAHHVWGDGTGYQLLLDPTAALYGNGIPTVMGDEWMACGASPLIYNSFPYKIPTNASSSCASSGSVINDAVTIQIPVGTYDWFIVNPDPRNNLIFTAGVQGLTDTRTIWNDYTFVEGYSYTLRMGLCYDNGELWGDEVTIIVEPDGEPCDSASNLSAIVTDNDVALTWTAASGAVIGYQILRNGVVIDTVYTTSYTNNNAPYGLLQYCVKAVYDWAFTPGDCVPASVCTSVTVGNVCDLRFEMQDRDGYGWDGASIEVLVDNFSHGTVTLSTGSVGSQIVAIPSGEVKLVWTKSNPIGIYDPDMEIGFQVYDKDDIMIFSAGGGVLGVTHFTNQQIVFTHNNNCEIFAPQYNVYRDGVLLTSSPILETVYQDTDFDPDVAHTWAVVTLCNNGLVESDTLSLAVGACSGANNACNYVDVGTLKVGSLITTGVFIPTYGNSYGQQLYTQSDIGNAGTITAIAFEYVQATPYVANNFKVYIGHTNQTEFASASTSELVPFSGLTEVYTGAVTFNNSDTVTWITFNTPFEYTGGGLVVACLNHHTGAPITFSNAFRYHSPGGTVTLVYRPTGTSGAPSGTATINPASIPNGTGTAYCSSTSSRINTRFNICSEVTLPEYDVTVTANPIEGGEVTGAGTYTADDEVTVTAIANEDYNFVNWTENDVQVSTNATYTFYIEDDRDLVANFIPVIGSSVITITANPTTGGAVSGVGTYLTGYQEVILSATPNTGYEFVNWTEADTIVTTDPTYTFMAGGNRDFVANFILKSYTITVAANNNSYGAASGGGTFSHFDEVTVTATPNANYIFENWTEAGTVVSTNATYTFTAESDRDLIANFVLKSYTITVAANNNSYGTASGGGTFPHGDEVTVTATPNTNHIFENWTEAGTIVSTNATYTFTAERNRDLIANFTSDTKINTVQESGQVKIYPNPVSDLLFIEADGVVKRVEILSLDGKKVITVVKGNASEISVSKLSSGAYLLRVTTDSGTAVQRFVKK